MSDDKPRPAHEPQPVRPEGGPTLPPAPAPAPDDSPAPGTYAAAPAPVAPRGFRERLGALRRSDGSRSFGLGALIASALAGVIVGGLGVTAVQAVGDDHGRGDWMEQHGPMGRNDDDLGGRGPMFGGPGGLPGQVQPPAPQDDDSGS